MVRDTRDREGEGAARRATGQVTEGMVGRTLAIGILWGHISLVVNDSQHF